MYYCKDCGEQFETPRILVETHGFEYPPYEEWAVCPACDCNDFVETMRCDYCCEYITGEYITLMDGTVYCEECYTKDEL